MIGRWWAEAGKYQVLPIDGERLERLNVERPTIARPRNKFVFYPGGSPVPFTAAPKTYNRPWSITAEVVIPKGGAEGVLLAQGGRTGGYTFFVKDHRLYFLYNWLGRDKFWLMSDEVIPEGEVELRYEFEPSGPPDVCPGPWGAGPRSALHQSQAGGSTSRCLTQSWLCSGTEGPDLRLRRRRAGCAGGIQRCVRFTGTIKRVTVDLSGELIPDTEADMRIAMMRQ